MARKARTRKARSSALTSLLEAKSGLEEESERINFELTQVKRAISILQTGLTPKTGKKTRTKKTRSRNSRSAVPLEEYVELVSRFLKTETRLTRDQLKTKVADALRAQGKPRTAISVRISQTQREMGLVEKRGKLQLPDQETD